MAKIQGLTEENDVEISNSKYQKWYQKDEESRLIIGQIRNLEIENEINVNEKFGVRHQT